MKALKAYHKNPLYKSGTLALLIIIGQTYGMAGIRDDLYENGKKSYKSADYGAALRDLYAYYILNQEAIDAMPDFQAALKEHIQICETKIAIALLATAGSDQKRTLTIFSQQQGGIKGTGKEIQDLLQSGKISIQSIEGVLAGTK